MFEPRQIANEERLNGRQHTVVVIMNLMLLVELTVCMYLGQQDPDTLTLFFLKTFLPVAGATLVGARMLVRRLGNTPGNRAAQ
ncbi:hypothetical protein DESC_200016 [Desulfosarcina cetonica]|uniref:hypothetical protein n=1 Tax=Desulfosarcina cetonica TaxID=90730 RepID=UPI0006D1EE04|nr:hypothetical protein [Desulfosarcina cetonica]VTR64581.1 hypothetical protein DESC_200016 [Desulfosarcina cetonica]